MREVTRTALLMREAALKEAAGNVDDALWIACEEWARNWNLKGSGIDREGGPRHAWKPEKPPAPIVTAGGK